MAEHVCAHEADLAVLASKIPEIANDIKEIKSSLSGVITHVAVLEKASELAPSPRVLAFYSTIGGGIVLSVAMFGKWAIGVIGG